MRRLRMGWRLMVTLAAGARTGSARATTKRRQAPPSTTSEAPVGGMLPILVGGTGRSGTTVLGRLIGMHPDLELLTPELKFLSARGSLSHLVDARTSYRTFEDRMLNRWFDRGPNIGLQRILSRSRIESELPALRRGIRAGDAEAAAGEFTHHLLDPVASASGARGWVEMTPLNARASDTLIRILPDMKLVHTVRDGRDVACSVVRVHWGPSDYDVALDWWANRLERAFVRSASLPQDQVLVVRLEDLVKHDRERQYARLLEFLGIDDDPAMRAFFETSMTPERAHIGRWREDVPPERMARFVEHHRRLAERLAARGFPYRPEPDEPAGAGPRDTAAPVAVQV